MDVYGIETGADFSNRLESALAQCGVLLVLIGKRWAGSDQSGGSRLQDPQDWVRLEVASALRRGMTVIPVLLDGASMPAERALSEELRPLTRLNAADVRTSRLNADVWDLSGSVMKALGETWPPPEPGSAIYAAVSSLYAFLAGAGLLFVLIGSMFVESVHAGTIFGAALLLVNALVVLRRPRPDAAAGAADRGRAAPRCVRRDDIRRERRRRRRGDRVWRGSGRALIPCGFCHATPRQKLGAGGGRLCFAAIIMTIKISTDRLSRLGPTEARFQAPAAVR
jgi:hypothetical protein